MLPFRGLAHRRGEDWVRSSRFGSVCATFDWPITAVCLICPDPAALDRRRPHARNLSPDATSGVQSNSKIKKLLLLAAAKTCYKERDAAMPPDTAKRPIGQPVP